MCVFGRVGEGGAVGRGCWRMVLNITSVPFPPGILESNSASHTISLPLSKPV